MCETWLSADLPDSIVSIPGYEIVSRKDGGDTHEGKGRGLIIYCRSELNATPIENAAVDNIIQCAGIEINLNKTTKEPTFIYLFYRPPRQPFSRDDNGNTAKICELISSLPENSIAVGDFNFPHTDWSCVHSTSAGEMVFLEAVRDRFLTQHTEEPTHSAGNILDLVFSDRPDDINSVEVLSPLSNSDHNMIQVEVTCKGSQEEEPKLIPNWNRLDISKIKQGFKEVDWTALLKEKGAEETWEIIRDTLDNLIRENLPQKRRKNINRPCWMNHRITTLMRKKEKLYKQLKKGNHDAKNKFNQIQKELKYAIRRSKKNYEDSLASDKNKNPRKYYGYINSVTKNKDSIGPLKDEEGNIITDSAQMAEKINNFFCSVFTKEDTTHIPQVENLFLDSDPLSDMVITGKMVSDKIKSMKSQGAPGPLGHWPCIVRQINEEITNPLTILYNKCLQESYCPEDWKNSNVSPIFKKKGKKSSPSNYRPVSLTSVLGKIMEACLKETIVTHLEMNNLLRESQHGFRSGRSVLSNLINHVDNLTSLVDSGIQVDVLYLDFAKAFDVIPHRRLLAKCKGLGIDGKILAWIERWLVGRRQRVIINGKSSAWQEVSSGVPQGSILGPLLFLVFINDIDNVINGKGVISKFADDTKVLVPIRNEEDAIEMQNIIHRLETWSNLWLMRFNTSKCSIMHFGKSNSERTYYMNGEAIKKSDSERDIGVVITRNCKPSEMCAKVSKKANQLLGLLSRGLSFKSKKNFLPLYKTYILPHLEFAQASWAPWMVGDKELLENIQKRALRQITDLKGKTYKEKLKECDILSVDDRRRRNDLILMYKVLHDMEGVDAKKIFQMAEREEQFIATRHSTSYMAVKVPKSRLDCRQNFWGVRVVNPWNDLENHIKTQPTLRSFITALDRKLKQEAWGED